MGRPRVLAPRAPGVTSRRLKKDLTCSPPRVVFIDTCNLCGLRCPYCPTGRRVMETCLAELEAVVRGR